MFRYAQRICVFTLAAAGAFAQTNSAPVPSTVAATSTTGMIGLAEGQGARLNVLNPGILAPATGANCSANLLFANAAGKVLKSTTVTVSPGQSMVFDILSSIDLNLTMGTRLEIRAIVAPALVPVASTITPPGSCTLIGTLEIYDLTTQRTDAVLGGWHDIPAAPVATPASGSN